MSIQYPFAKRGIHDLTEAGDELAARLEAAIEDFIEATSDLKQVHGETVEANELHRLAIERHSRLEGDVKRMTDELNDITAKVEELKQL
jgi:predicted nuclease with TOPRIM domain